MAQNTAVELAQSLAFEVEAIPHENVTKFKSAGTPLNVKIRVRKKEKGAVSQGVISISKFGRPEDALERIRLASSDQTIMSFNMLMESEFDKLPMKKRKRFLGTCFGSTYDDDDSPYLPAKDTASLSRSESEILKNKLKLAKNQDPLTNQNTFFGKCKPGGCLDPPFGEERYKYMPRVPDQRNSLQKQVQIKKSSEKIDVEDEPKKSKVKRKSEELEAKKEPKQDVILNLYPSQNKIITLEDSESIITYPPENSEESHNEWQDQDKSSGHRRQSSSSSRSKRSFNELGPNYYPKKKDSTKDGDKFPAKTSKEGDRNLEKDKDTPISTKDKPLSGEKKNYTAGAAIGGGAAALAVVTGGITAMTHKKETKQRVSTDTSDDLIQKPQSSKASFLTEKKHAITPSLLDDKDSITDVKHMKKVSSEVDGVDKSIDTTDMPKNIPIYDKRSSTILKKSQFSSKDKTDIWDEEERRLSRIKNITIIDDNKEPKKEMREVDNLSDHETGTESGNEFLESIERKKSIDKPINIREDKKLGIDAMKEHRFSYSGSRDLIINDRDSTSSITQKNATEPKKDGIPSIPIDQLSPRRQSSDRKINYAEADKSKETDYINSSDQSFDRKKSPIDTRKYSEMGTLDSSGQGSDRKEILDITGRYNETGTTNIGGQGYYSKDMPVDTDSYSQAGDKRLSGQDSDRKAISVDTGRYSQTVDEGLSRHGYDRKDIPVDTARYSETGKIDLSDQVTQRKESYANTDKYSDAGTIDSSGQGLYRKDRGSSVDEGSYKEKSKRHSTGPKRKESREEPEKYSDIGYIESSNQSSSRKESYIDTSNTGKIPTNFDESSLSRSPITEVHILPDAKVKGSESEPIITKMAYERRMSKTMDDGSLTSKASVLELQTEIKTEMTRKDKAILGIVDQKAMKPSINDLQIDRYSGSGKENGSDTKRFSISSSDAAPKLSPTSSVVINLALKRTSNENREVIVKSLDSDIPRIGEDNVIIVKAKLKPQGKEIRVQVTEDSDMAIKLKKTALYQTDRVQNKSLNFDVKFDTGIAEEPWHQRYGVNKESVQFSERNMQFTIRNEIHEVLSSIYVQDLMPVQKVIKSLKEDVDLLAGQLTSLKKPTKLTHSTKRCACMRKKM